MKILDIVNQLRFNLPIHTDYFSKTVDASSIVVSGGILTVVTNTPHGLSNTDIVTLSNIKTQTSIDSFAKDGLVFEFTTLTAHDLTFGWRNHRAIELIGFTDSNWNDSFTLLSVANRFKFSLNSSNSSPVLNGNEKLLEDRIDGPSGSYSVTVIDATTFTANTDAEDGTYIGGKVSSNTRIAGSVTIDRALEQYTKQQLNNFWGFVVPHNTEVSKSRETLNDGISTTGSGETIRQLLIDGFDFFVFVNTSEEIAAEKALDICRHDLLSPVLNSIYGVKFTTGSSVGESGYYSVFTGHAGELYKKSVYVHKFSFEISFDITNEDRVQPANTKAFRDVEYLHEVGDGANINFTIDDV